MTYTITKRWRFEAAHHLIGMPEGHKCAAVHGHSYTVTLTLCSETLDVCGMVTDFANLAPFGGYIARTLDHQDLNAVCADDDSGPLLPNPTSELLAEQLFRMACRVLPAEVAEMVVSVTVSETDRTSATYAPAVPAASGPASEGTP